MGLYFVTFQSTLEAISHYLSFINGGHQQNYREIRHFMCVCVCVWGGGGGGSGSL